MNEEHKAAWEEARTLVLLEQSELHPEVLMGPSVMKLTLGHESASIIATALAAYNEYEELDIEMSVIQRRLREYARVNLRD